LPESQIRQFIERLLGADAAAEIETVLKAGQDALAAGDLGMASQAFAAVLEAEPENTKAIAGLARCFLAGGDREQAREVLQLAPAGKVNDAELAGVRAALDLASEAAGAGDAAGLRARVEANPADLQARFDLAGALVARGDLGPATEQLLAILERDRTWNEEAARKQLLKIFDAAGPTSEVARTGRRKLSAILFS